MSLVEEGALRGGFLITEVDGLPEPRLLRPVGEPPQIVVDGCASRWERVGMIAEMLAQTMFERYGEEGVGAQLRARWQPCEARVDAD